MASEEAKCPVCGKALEGRDRFEAKCAACREAEVLGHAMPGEDAAAAAPVARGASSARRRRLAVLLVLLAVVAVAAVVVVFPGGPRTVPPARATIDRTVIPPSPTRGEGAPVAKPAPTPRKPAEPQQAEALREETASLLAMLASGDYERVLNNYAQPNEVDFRRVERALDEIVRGDAAAGFAAWSTRVIRLREAGAAEELRKANDPQPEFTVALLSHLSRDPGASGAGASSENRARNVLRWHLNALFGGLDLAGAQPGAIEEAAPASFEVAIRCGGARAAAWLRDEPLRIVWRKLPVGWVIATGLAERLERVREVLKRPPAASSTAP